MVNSAGCGAMLKDYAHHLRDDLEWAERAAAFRRAVRDLERGARRSAAADHARLGGKVVLSGRVSLAACPAHQSPAARLAQAHSRAGAGRDRRGWPVLRQRWRLQRHQPGQVAPVAAAQTRHALAAGPTVIVTTNPGCLLQLQSGLAARHAASRYGTSPKCLDEVDRTVTVGAAGGPGAGLRGS